MATDAPPLVHAGSQRVITTQTMSLRDLRRSREISLRELEQMTGINRAVWSQIERGHLLPQSRHLRLLGLALNVPPWSFTLTFAIAVEVPE